MLHQRANGLARASVVFAALCVAAAIGTVALVSGTMQTLKVETGLFWPIAVLAILATATLFRPALKAYAEAGSATTALNAGDIVKARIETASARENAQVTFGWGAFALIILGFVCFLMMNGAKVQDTFFRPSMLVDNWWLVTGRFIGTNVFIFVIAEILVLVWGLVVALARIAPGRAGKPVRAMAIAYCDLFRGLPAILTLYLIGFGIPTSGISDIIMTWIMGWFVDLNAMEPAAMHAAIRIDVVYWAIIALTLTYGAYVAEVYRAGIESIHHSQFMAARSLGLSYLQTMRHVIVPQAVRRIIAPLLNDFIGLQKDTALVQILGVIDAFSQSKIIAANKFNLSAVSIVAVLFVLVTIPQARLVDKLVERDNARMKAGG